MESFDESRAAKHVRDYLSIVWQRKWLCLLVFVVLASAGLFVVLKVLKPWYQAGARISIERFRAPVSEQTTYAGEAFYQTQFEIIRATKVAALAAYKLGRSQSPEQAEADGTADMIRRAISIAPESNTRVVRISSRQRDPQTAASIVNRVVEAYIEFAQSNEEALANKRQKDMQDQIRTLELKIEDKKRALDEFARDANLQEQQQEQRLANNRLTALLEAQVPAQVGREQAAKNYDELKSKFDAGEDLVENFTSPAAERINDNIRELETRIRVMSVGKTARALENDLEYQQTKELIAQYQQEYSDRFERDLRQANERALQYAEDTLERAQKVEESYDSQMADLKLKLAQLAEVHTSLSRYQELRKELDNHQRMHDNLQQTLLTAKLADDLTVLNITVLDAARPPGAPAWPNKTHLSAVVVALAFLTAAGLAFFLDYMDRSVRRPEDVEQELRMPFMGFVPSAHFGSNNSHRREKVVLTDPSSGPAESYRKIRAKINVYKGESHAKTFAITSTTAGEGKTTLASNLSVSFAQSGLSALLIDADMRHPKIHDICEIERVPGLGDYLAGECSWESVVHSSGTNGLSVIPAGTGGSRSAELLENPRLRELLKVASEKYDVVVLDSPPVLGVADATILCNLADATIFVIQASRNSKWLIRRARMELKAAEANVIGAILNRVRSQRGDYYYYHRYYPKKN